MKGKTARIVMVASVLVLMACSVVAAPDAAKAETINLSFSHFLPASHFLDAQGFALWGKAVEERSGGRIKITFYPAQTLTKAKDNYESVVKGVADIACASLSYSPGRFPLTEVFSLPFLGKGTAMIATQVYQDLYKQVPEVAAEYAQVKVLWLHNSSAPGLMSRDKPIRSLEDFQKMLVRVPGPQAELVKALGATPVSMAVPDTYLAMDKGTVNAMIMPKEALVTFKLHEVTKSLTLGAETMFAPFCVAMNLQKWNSVPQDLQQIIDEESTKAAILNAKGWDRMDQEAVDLIKSQGKVIVQLSPEEVNRWREKAEGLRKEWIAARQDNKLPGKKVLDLTTDLFEKYGK